MAWPPASERPQRHSTPAATQGRQQLASSGEKERRTLEKTPRCIGETEGARRQQGCGGGKLGQPAKADARPGAEQSEEEQVRESAGEWELGVHLYTAQGRQGAWQRRQGTRQGSSAMVATSTDTRRP